MAEAAMLERHIMQAQARAMSADEKQLNRSQTMTSGFPDLGLPPGKYGIYLREYHESLEAIRLTSTGQNAFTS